MTKVGFLFLLVSALAVGCKKGGGGGGDDCKTAVDKVFTLAMPDEVKQLSADKQAKFRGAFEASCKEDNWPAEGKKCISAANTKEDLDKCEKSMEGVEDKLEARLEAVQKEVMAAEGGGSAAPPPPPTDPAAGGGSAAPPPGGGGGGAAAGGGGDVAKFIADYEALRDKLCACADKACADKIKAEADAHERSAKSKGLRQPTPEEGAKFEKVEDEINECARKHK